jgi:hypothetical protein
LGRIFVLAKLLAVIKLYTYKNIRLKKILSYFIETCNALNKQIIRRLRIVKNLQLERLF